MKKIIKPGFEFIFSAALIAILGLPPLVLAQTQKSIEIQIINGDTTVNGKDIKKLSPGERKDALAEINNMPQTPAPPAAPGHTNAKVTIKKRTNGGDNNIIIERSITRDDQPTIAGLDSSTKNVKIRLKKLKGADSVQAFTYRFDNDLPPMDMDINTYRYNGPDKNLLIMHERNAQTFHYTNTDNDGISTNISFRVSDVSKDKAKRVAGNEKAELSLNDLNLVPEFSTGKTTISFNLPTKTLADVKFTDTKGTLLWADKVAAGFFSKKISLPLNGVYYLQVNQGTAVAVKKIIKE